MDNVKLPVISKLLIDGAKREHYKKYGTQFTYELSTDDKTILSSNIEQYKEARYDALDLQNKIIELSKNLDNKMESMYQYEKNNVSYLINKNLDINYNCIIDIFNDLAVVYMPSDDINNRNSIDD